MEIGPHGGQRSCRCLLAVSRYFPAASIAAPLNPVAVNKGSHAPLSSFAYHSSRISSAPREKPDPTPKANLEQRTKNHYGILGASLDRLSKNNVAIQNTTGTVQKPVKQPFSVRKLPVGNKETIGIIGIRLRNNSK